MKYLMITASLALALGAGSLALAATSGETGAGTAPAAGEQSGAGSEATDAASGEIVTRGAPGAADQPSSEGTGWRSGGTGSSVEGFGPAQSSEDVLKTDPRSVPEDAPWQPGDPVDLPSIKQPGREESAASGLDRQTAIEEGREREMASGQSKEGSKAPGFSKVDKDKDGQLTMEEVQDAFKQADKDGDGRISRQEWKEAGRSKGEQSTREMGAEVPDTMSEQRGDPSAGDPAYFTDEAGRTSERGATEIPTVDPLAGQVPGTGGALERDAGMVEEPGAKEPVPTGERGHETVVDERPGDERLLKPGAEQDEEAAKVMRGTAGGEAKTSEEARRMIESSESKPKAQ